MHAHALVPHTSCGTGLLTRDRETEPRGCGGIGAIQRSRERGTGARRSQEGRNLHIAVGQHLLVHEEQGAHLPGMRVSTPLRYAFTPLLPHDLCAHLTARAYSHHAVRACRCSSARPPRTASPPEPHVNERAPSLCAL
jgi:hypothetical protein